MKADSSEVSSRKANPAMKSGSPSGTRSAPKNDEVLSSIDPVIEGSSFQVMDEAALESASAIPANTPSSFNLAASLAQIPEKMFFRIGEVADLLGVKAYVLRFWETEFSMIHPTKSRSGQRVYRKKDVEMLFLIKHLLYVERFSIEGARKRIRELKVKPANVASKVASSSASTAVSPPPMPAEKKTAGRDLLIQIKELASLPISAFFRF